jgi:aspartyl-tRNA(Asn)/glutamyl-tRNA(Gln) amidotransferase subunit C
MPRPRDHCPGYRRGPSCGGQRDSSVVPSEEIHLGALRRARDPASLQQKRGHDRLHRSSPWALLATIRTVSSVGIEIMSLTREEVEYVAALARLGLSDEEIARLQDQLSSILEHIEVIDRLDTDAIPPTAQVIDMTNVMRTDVVTGSLSREAVLENAPRQADGFFEVHAILGSALEDA